MPPLTDLISFFLVTWQMKAVSQLKAVSVRIHGVSSTHDFFQIHTQKEIVTDFQLYQAQ